MIWPLLARSLLLPCCITYAFAAPPPPSSSLVDAPAPAPPSVLYGPLFDAVQTGHLFADEKAFTDMDPTAPPAQIVADYARRRAPRGPALTIFVNAHFASPHRTPAFPPIDPRQDIASRIDTLWSTLEHAPDVPTTAYSSLLPLPYPYLLSSWHFDEIHYWDSYFLMLGLEATSRHALALNQLNDIASLIDRYGHMPASNRSYDLSHSEPPFFSLMVDLIAAREGPQVYQRYRPELELEYAYWMDGAAELTSGTAFRRVVRLRDGTVLNRYWDDRATPRDISYREDLASAHDAGLLPGAHADAFYRNLRACSESGWNGSSRWMADGLHPATLRTTSLLPVDLNALLHHLEVTLAHVYRATGDRAHAENLLLRAAQRKAAIERLMWDNTTQAFTDYDWTNGKQTHSLNAATVYPLFLHIATPAQGSAIAQTLRAHLLKAGGLLASTNESGAPWDAPNGWASLEWMAIVGLRDYGHAELARTIARRWIRTNLAAYDATGQLAEKYDVLDPARNAAAIGAHGNASGGPASAPAPQRIGGGKRRASRASGRLSSHFGRHLEAGQRASLARPSSRVRQARGRQLRRIAIVARLGKRMRDDDHHRSQEYDQCPHPVWNQVKHDALPTTFLILIQTDSPRTPSRSGSFFDIPLLRPSRELAAGNSIATPTRT
ncbi:MAG: trehalase family glycosidase [Pararobbsia sp.]